MKIALVCPDGLSILLFCKGIIGELKRINGAEVFIISADGVYKKDIENLGVKSISVEIYRFFNPLRDFGYLLSLYRVFRNERFDIIINFSTKPNIFGSIAAKLSRTNKIVSHVVGLGTAFLPAVSLQSKILQYIVLQFYRIACKMSDSVWFTNKNDVEFFISKGIIAPEKVVLTKNYLDIDYYSLKFISKDEIEGLKKELRISDQNRVVVMIARMIWSKGIKEFAEAAEILKDSHPHLKFFLVAPLEDGSANAVPESYIKEKEKTSNLMWLGFRSDVRNFYAISDVAVLPSYYKEGGYPRALLEPMAMGKALVTTDSGDCRGTVEHGENGYLIPVRDSRALAVAIASIIDDDAKRARFGKYSRQKAEKEFDETKIVAHALKELGICAKYIDPLK